MITIDEIKILLHKNRKRLAKELDQSKELVILLNKSAYTKLTEQEKITVKTQLLDICKSIPAFTIFMLPGGIILLPIVAKLIPDIMPNIFKGDAEDDVT
jgi:hypothetical protein